MSASPSDKSEEELVRQARAGDLEAFEDLLYRYERRVYAFAREQLRTEIDAREVTQDTFVKAFQSLSQFDLRRSFAPWLFTIARRKCLDHHRRAAPLPSEPVPELPDLNTPDHILSAEDERALLWNCARECLPALQYQAIWLRYAEDMNVAEIASILGKTQIYTKVLLFRARHTLSLRMTAFLPGNTAHKGPQNWQHPVRNSHLKSGERLIPLPGHQAPV